MPFVLSSLTNSLHFQFECNCTFLKSVCRLLVCIFRGVRGSWCRVEGSIPAENDRKTDSNSVPFLWVLMTANSLASVNLPVLGPGRQWIPWEGYRAKFCHCHAQGMDWVISFKHISLEKHTLKASQTFFPTLYSKKHNWKKLSVCFASQKVPGFLYPHSTWPFKCCRTFNDMKNVFAIYSVEKKQAAKQRVGYNF